MRIIVLFGTESGTAEFVAGDLAKKLGGEFEVIVSDMAEYPVTNLNNQDFYVFVSSTYGEGDPPLSAKPFLATLDRDMPDLSGVRYAIFGVGDSAYPETYCGGSQMIAKKMEIRGAFRVGEFGQHDASGRDHPTDVALEWIKSIVPLAMGAKGDLAPSANS
ncbi:MULTISPECIES: flavodoxin family protein [unclassified Mesorhizobium]|uniref:flavodoxin domain-containing protein n=1 Tax=unclassified Mesorhizobium TaxID=325217 RepID=UPI000FD9EB4C|nr:MULTISPECIES: flavodoxin family protein [unclassified Mesorhizobium]TGR23007.1 nitric oxide synthase [Mesorhizobium sp. M8A.F.Ca.ET.197.01.1.1]TGR39092.1 nitric oxide synthase [bacterium M00.F.Ca.ET.199.01.1.1]TGR46686.1 nitric oxide synthase [Mesorhizobium sp. M8A.F.Ca.ET.198.01.1.1]TGV85240.1 nitric oxide synthase [Mesorhizobium sp. M00.F.Ca.ET.149.01.1.1]